MARGKEAAADEPKKRKRKGAESSDEEAQAAEDDKENQQLNGVEAEEMKEEEKGGEQEEEEEEDEEDAAASKGKRKKASSSSDSPSSKKGSGGGDAHSVVLAYMQRTNRPYSAINVADNLQGALSKTQTVKVLDELTESGKLTAKEFGKSKVYFAAQKDKDATPEDMASIDRQIAELTEQVTKVRAATASLQAELNAATAEPDDDALDAELLELQKSGPALEKKLASMKSGNDSMPAADVEALQRQFNVYLTEWKKRRKGAKEMIGMVAEGAAKSWKEKNFCEDQGIETDEAVKARVEDWQPYWRDVKPLPKEVKGKGKKK